MVAYSFQRRFVNSIRVGLGLNPLPDFPTAAGPKRHTIRSNRKRGHAHEGDALQLFFAQRTQHCFLIASARCVGTSRIGLVFDDEDDEREGIVSPGFGNAQWGFASLDEFAMGDGFANWAAFKSYWRGERGVRDEFDGTIIFWEQANDRSRASGKSDQTTRR